MDRNRALCRLCGRRAGWKTLLYAEEGFTAIALAAGSIPLITLLIVASLRSTAPVSNSSNRPTFKERNRCRAELIEDGIFESVEDARSEVFSYIEGYYNRTRLHSSLNYKSLLQLENELKIIMSK